MKNVSVDPARASVCRALLAALRDRQSVQHVMKPVKRLRSVSQSRGAVWLDTTYQYCSRKSSATCDLSQAVCISTARWVVADIGSDSLGE